MGIGEFHQLLKKRITFTPN